MLKLNDEEIRIIIGALQDRQSGNDRKTNERQRTYGITTDLIDKLRMEQAR